MARRSLEKQIPATPQAMISCTGMVKKVASARGSPAAGSRNLGPRTVTPRERKYRRAMEATHCQIVQLRRFFGGSQENIVWDLREHPVLCRVAS